MGVWTIICLSILCFSCKTKQKVITDNAGSAQATQNIQTVQNISTKSTVKLSQNWKELFTSSATLRIKRDSLILLSIQPIAGIEAARISLDQQHLTLIDRIHKQYVQMSYEELNNHLKQSGNSSMKPDCFFHIIQSILCSELFLCESTRPAQKSDFTVTDINGSPFLQHSYQSLMQEFVADSTSHLSSGSLFDESMRLKWTYFPTRLPSMGEFPVTTNLDIQTTPQNKTTLFLNHKTVNFNSDTNFSNSIPKSYKEVTLEELMSSLQTNS